MTILEIGSIVQFIVVIIGGSWAISTIKADLSHLTQDFASLERKFEALEQVVWGLRRCIKENGIS